MGTTRKLKRYIIRRRVGSKGLKGYKTNKSTPKKKSALKRGIMALKNLAKKAMGLG